jgi:hypothetical protein
VKRPAFQFYPGDWRKDVELRACSLAARGLWIDLMCVAHDCEPYGHLMLNGKPMTMQQMAGQIGVPAAQVKKLLDELIESGVARTTDQGAIYSKRMVADERIRNVRAEGGKAGAEHGAKGASHGSKGGRPPKPKGGFEPPLEGFEEPPPSSSSATSTSNTPSVDGVPRPTPGEACKAMKATGMQSVSPADPRLIALLDAGMTIAELVAAAADAVERRKPFAYALKVAESRRHEAAAIGNLPAAAAPRNGNKHAAAAAAIFDMDDERPLQKDFIDV